jgi:hypothetical protein
MELLCIWPAPRKLRRILCVLASLAGLALGVTAASAQSVFVRGEGGANGQGYMVSSAGGCYLLLPAHVAGEFPYVDVITEAPVRIGQAIVSRPFWTFVDGTGALRGIDLAVGVVRGAPVEACTAPLDRFRPPARLSAAEGDLVTIREDGQIERVRMAVTETRYLEFDAEVRSPGAEMYPGRSGSILFIGGDPAGMIVRSAEADQTRGTFVRTEEIVMNARRWIEDQGVQFAGGSAPEGVEQRGGFSVRLHEVSAPPVGPEYPAEATLRPEGVFLSEPSRPLRIVYAVEGENPASLTRVVVTSDPAGGYALPRGVLIEVDSTPNGTRPRTFWSGQMPPDGLIDTGVRTGTTARWIILTIQDARSAGPVGIGHVRFE